MELIEKNKILEEEVCELQQKLKKVEKVAFILQEKFLKGDKLKKEVFKLNNRERWRNLVQWKWKVMKRGTCGEQDPSSSNSKTINMLSSIKLPWTY